MTTATIQSVNLLPIYFQTDKNSKFLSNTIDQLIQPTQLERLNSFVGSTSTPTYKLSDFYVRESEPLRQAYQLDPALVVYDIEETVQSLVTINDLSNEIKIRGGYSDNFDRLYGADVYPYYPHIDLDKFINYQNYFWSPDGSFLITIGEDFLDVDNLILGLESASVQVNGQSVSLLNGMLVTFTGKGVDPKYQYKEFYVEGVGTSITLVDTNKLIVPEKITELVNDQYDSQGYDFLGYDSDTRYPKIPEYVTINRASLDGNPWSRYNRWVSLDVIKASSLLNNSELITPISNRANRPIIEFNKNLKLYNFGSTAIEPVDLLDRVVEDAFSVFRIIEGAVLPSASTATTGIFIDGVRVEYGNRVIFTADKNPLIKDKVFIITFVDLGDTNEPAVALYPALDVPLAEGLSVVVKKGKMNGGSSFWFNGNDWIRAQQHTQLNEAPLFDLFDSNGISYSNLNYYLSNLSGNKVFGYEIDPINPPDKILGLNLAYLNGNLTSSILFKNYFSNGTINLINNFGGNSIIRTDQTFLKIDDQLVNIWQGSIKPKIAVNTSTGYYDLPLSLSNNPLNASLDSFTLGDLSNQKYNTGTQLIINSNPISFAMMFIGKKEHSVINAIINQSQRYNYFKESLINYLSLTSFTNNPAEALDEILLKINEGTPSESSFYLSDMVGHGQNKTVLFHKVAFVETETYLIPEEFSLKSISNKSTLVYINGLQLTYGIDYEFDSIDPYVYFLKSLKIGDDIKIVFYNDTKKSFIPPTPTKLGLYPSFIPKIYLDNTYATPVNVIQGHDGSIIAAFNDYRDAILLEYELRVFNNLKVSYQSDLFDIHKVDPGFWRDKNGISNYSFSEITAILQKDFIKWATDYGIDYTANNTFDLTKPFTWNYVSNIDSVKGSVRSLFKYYYDTDRPHTHPWEMLGFSIKPVWWDSKYGPLPYTAGNRIMWEDLSAGRILVTDTGPIINEFYARPGLMDLIPVDNEGALLNPAVIGLAINTNQYSMDRSWAVGDHGPAETAWRRSSYWPFTIQKLLALTCPASYCSLMYDPANMKKNILGQWVYGKNEVFLNLKQIPIHGENDLPNDSGYSVIISEIGKKRDFDYISKLKSDLNYCNFNLVYKVGGFVGKNTLQIFIDAYEPSTNSPESLLPDDDYMLTVNVSNPIKSASISGIIIQRVSKNFVVRGYDQDFPYFTYHPPIKANSSSLNTVGGTASEFVDWSSSISDPLSTTYYQKGQVVKYGSKYYRTLVSHQSGETFDTTLFSKLSSLPISGGVTVQSVSNFDKRPVQVPYGTTFTKIQDVYDLIVGYGDWLVSQGFYFNQFNIDLQCTVDWNLSANEFLYWTTQNWIDNSIISISPFADQISYYTNNSVVDNIFNDFYGYNFFKSDGTSFDKSNLFITRSDNNFIAKTINTDDGIYFAKLNSIQKEHAIVFKNTTIFGDIVYDIQTGERQQRVKLVGFRTANWNGGLTSPGFINDSIKIKDWEPNQPYLASSIVRYNNFYYSAFKNINSESSFDFVKWKKLEKKPNSKLFPNFDYKISQFNDFYSLDIDNFDVAQKQSAQSLVGYGPRSYLENIISNPISQYKFYQGFIKEKGTANTIAKLVNKQDFNNEIRFYETWALRVGQYGSFTSSQEFEFPLIEGTFLENPQIVTFTEPKSTRDYSPVYYINPLNFTIYPSLGAIPNIKATTSTNIFQLMNAGYVRIDDVDATAYNLNSLLDVANNRELLEGNTIWLGFKPNGDWDVLRYSLFSSDIIAVDLDEIYNSVTVTTSLPNKLSKGQVISIVGVSNSIDGVYVIESKTSPTQFTVINNDAFVNDQDLNFPGFVFIFESMRFGNFDLISTDEKLYNYDIGTYFWIDSGNNTNNNGWEVYKKVLNYQSSKLVGRHSALSQGFGYHISTRNNSNILVAGAPIYSAPGKSGAFFLYDNKKTKLSEISFFSMDNTAGNNNKLGYAVFYDDRIFPNSNFGLVFAGAPGAYNNSGTVLIFSINEIYDARQQGQLTNPNSNSTGTFGASIFVQRNTGTKQVLIGAPKTNQVYSYVITSTNAANLLISQPILTTSSVALSTDAQWGYSIVGSDNAKYIAISAPYNDKKNVNSIVANSSTSVFDNIGTVSVIYNSTVTQTIYSPFGDNGNFGLSMAMSQDGSYLAVAAPNTLNNNNSYGAVAVYNTGTNGRYTLTQILYNLVPNSKMYFGMSLSINSLSNALVVSALGTNTTVITTFDTFTTFDFDVTRFTETQDYSGTVYLYNRKKSRFVFSQEIIDSSESVNTLTNFGNSIAVSDDLIFVGSPSTLNQTTGSIFTFSKIDQTIDGLERVRVQEDLITPSSINQIRLIDTKLEKIINYYDFVDPIKGKILGIADEELTYKESSDPAVYSIGREGVTVNANLSWIDQQVGQLWWDLSNTKFIWYEQGEIEYRRNNWGKLFPGASIDIYEWVGSDLLPSDWSALADTQEGLARGISGQPKYVDNSTLAVKQIYDNITGTFGNVYYYWVKNKITVPNVKNRNTSAFSVARYIANPTEAGIQYAAFISTSSLMLANFSAKFRSNEISLNFTIDNTNNKVQKHVEWQLVNEGVTQDQIPSLLETKMIDSLIGYDSEGNLVPDPKLSDRLKYGIGIRPRQTLFKNRLTALRNIVEFANGILLNTQVVGNYNFSNLNAEESLPIPTTSSWVVVEEVLDLDNIDTSVVNKASVISDSYQNGNWSVYQFDGIKWDVVQTQSYNTKLYWEYVDWVSPEFNIYKTISHIINDPYQLGAITSTFGQYIKINNRGDGRFVIVTPSKLGDFGTFGNNYDILFIQNGTIQIKDILWSYIYGWDSNNAFSQGLFDQTPNKEISYILSALKNDLFINDLSKNWNSLFFKAVKFALSEQKFVDWAFKTSFIDVINYSGTLTQTSVYKLQDDTYYEKYINEVKPYHTQVKRFTASFDSIDISDTTVTDFDYSLAYDSVSNQFVSNPIPIENFNFPEIYNSSTGVVITEFLPLTTKFVNVPWRELTNKILFDRITTQDQIGNLTVVDHFNGAVNNSFFELSWVADTDKSKIFVSIDGIPVYSSGFEVLYDSKPYMGYTKQYSYLKLLPNSVPSIVSDNTTTFTLSVTYQKNPILMSASERIYNLYNPTPDMLKKDITQLMSGAVDPRKVIGGQYEGTGFGNVNSGMVLDSMINPGISRTITVPNTVTGIDNITEFYGINGVVITGTNASTITINVSSSTVTIVDIDDNAITGQYTSSNGLRWNFSKERTIVYPSTGYPTWINSGLSGRVGGLGINPNDVIIDGSVNFIPTQPNQAPEELVPGAVGDSLAVNVYTKSAYQSPTIFNSSKNITKSTLTSVIELSIMPPTTSSIVVTFNNRVLSYVSTLTNLENFPSFSIDWSANQLILPPQTASGILSYLILGVGDSNPVGLGMVDSQSVTVDIQFTTSTGKLITMVNYRDVGSAYVTVDGTPIDNISYPIVSGNPVFYSINTASNRDSRAVVNVRNLTTGTHLIQAWIFNSTSSQFNKIVEQNYYVGDTPVFVNDASGFATGIQLTRNPMIFGPMSETIVEIIPDDGPRVRLRPPHFNYYKVTNTNIFEVGYPIVASTSSFVVDTVQGKNIRVYLDGRQLAYGSNKDLDYYIENNLVYIATRPIVFGTEPKIGSIIAIETFYYNEISNSTSITDGSVEYDYDYLITGEQAIGYTLLLTPNYSSITSSTVRILTFHIQDSLGVISKKFLGNPSRTYTLDYPVLNSNYLWVQVSSTSTGLLSLTNGLDYQVLEDNLTVLIGDNINATPADTVFIKSFADPNKSEKTLGYRITKDFLGKTSFTRLSNDDSTYLTQPLEAGDEQIHIADGSILSPADDNKNVPGVVLIAGERIEFFNNIDNVLSNLRRATGGTSQAEYLEIGTLVMDQGKNQIINEFPATPYSDVVLIQNTYTSSVLENTYTISTTTISTWINPVTSSTVRCDGITLTTATAPLPFDPYTGKVTYKGRIYPISTSSINAKDQIEVYYGGYLLRKDQSFYHDTTISYDGISIDQIKGEVASANDLATKTPYLGDAYICQDTNQVWVSTINQYNLYGVPSYVYSGLKRIPPDFTITTATQRLILNTATVSIQTGTLLTVVKKQVGSSWNDIVSINTSKSLLVSTGTIAQFLNSGLALLPAKYFYESPPPIVGSSDQTLT